MKAYVPKDKKEALKNTIFSDLELGILKIRFEDGMLYYLVNQAYKDYPYPIPTSKYNKFFSVIFSRNELEKFAGCPINELQSDNKIFDASGTKSKAELCLKWDCYPMYLQYLNEDSSAVEHYWSKTDYCHKPYNLGPSLSDKHRSDYLLWKNASDKNVLVAIDLNK